MKVGQIVKIDVEGTWKHMPRYGEFNGKMGEVTETVRERPDILERGLVTVRVGKNSVIMFTRHLKPIRR